LNLDKLIKKHPRAQLLVLSEYTFDGPVPETIKAWCRTNQRYVVVGGKDPAPGSQYYDTDFVIGPSGEVIFKQGKSVPIQFFKDGLPAREQKLWDSPWGKIGFCVCYDLSYSRVTDQLIRLGAQAIIVPTMDVVDWGRHQHKLHARVAPIRAAEYRVPIFRLASSGISQCVDANGCVLATAPMPGDGAMIFGALQLGKTGSLPWDRVLAPASVGMTSLTIVWLIGICIRQWKNP
jgi:predicted amidohydrolase